MFSCFALHFLCGLVTITAPSVPHESVRKMGIRDKIPHKNDVFLQLFTSDFTDFSVENHRLLCLSGAKMSWSSFFDSSTSQYNLKIRKSSCIIVACMMMNLMSKAQTGNRFTCVSKQKKGGLLLPNSWKCFAAFFFQIAPPCPPECGSGSKLHDHNYLC